MSGLDALDLHAIGRAILAVHPLASIDHLRGPDGCVFVLHGGREDAIDALMGDGDDVMISHDEWDRVSLRQRRDEGPRVIAERLLSDLERAGYRLVRESLR